LFGKFLPLGGKFKLRNSVPIIPPKKIKIKIKKIIERIFLKINVPKLPDLQESFYEISIFRQQVPAGCQNIAGFLNCPVFFFSEM
jgi:hypothetical protein